MEITATEINNDKQNIDEIVKKSVIAYNKKKIAKRKREIERAEDRKLSKDEINQLAIEIIKSEDSKEFEKNERLVVESEKNRLNDFRNQIQSLNDLTLESAEMEESGLQVSSDFPTYNDLIFKSRVNNKLFEKYEKLKQTYFKQVLLSKNAEFYSDIEGFENEDYMMKCLQIIYDMQDMYNIDEKTEDYSIFERFGYDTNIDLSYRLADYIIKNILFTENNNIQNIANYIINQNKVESEKKKQLAEDRIINNELLVKLLSKDFITNNKVCLLENSYINNLSLKKLYRTRTLGELLLEIINPENASTEKALRHQFYCTYEPIRPTKEHYYAWNGLQVFDIDLKEWEGSVDNLKKLLYQELIPFHWFLWIVKSSSGKGLHIYTKVAPPHHIYTKPQDNEVISKYWYYVNYITKQSNINDAIQRLATFNKIAKYPNWNKELDCEYLDNTTARITTGVKLSYDPLPLVNQNFIDLHPALGLSQTLDGLEYETTILRVLLRDNKFNRFITLINDELRQEANANIEKVNLDDVDLSKYVKTNIDLSGLTILPRNQINYFTRYNVCNTLAPLFGKDGLQIAHVILDSKKCKNESEINGFYACAITNKKQPSKVGLEILTKCGVLKQNIAPEILQPMYNSEKAYLRDCMLTAIRCEDEYEYEYKLEDGKYLGDYFDEILSRITHEKINILDVPAGGGKCLGYGTKILMYDGSYKEVQDIVVGDKLMGPDSTPRNVLSTCTGQEEMFEIQQNKGINFVCNKSHILSVIYTGKWKDYKFGNLPNRNVIEDKDIKYFIDLKVKNEYKLFKVPLSFQEQKVILPPYYLGYWLGDESKDKTMICCGEQDNEQLLKILNIVAKNFGCKIRTIQDSRNNAYSHYIVTDRGQRNPLLDGLKHYNLIKNKHIPKEYLYNSRRIRLQLFAGLVDSDGGGSNGTYDFTTNIDQLKDDIIFLARSLGYYVSVGKKFIKYLNGKEINKEYWRIKISGDFSDLPVQYERKRFVRNINKNPLMTGFKIKSLGIGTYYGFEIDGDKRFLLEDFTVTHNTSIVKQLAKNGKRVLLVLPYISVIKNKVENDETIINDFDVFYGNKSIKDMEYGINAVTTFDKFSKANVDKISNMFDYIFIDESHLLFTSQYRIEATSSALKKIKELYYISSTNQFASKLVLMSGTLTGEEFFFKNVGNFISVYKKPHNKTMEFLLCDDNLDGMTRLASKTKQLIEAGYRLLIPTNKGEIYTEKLIGMIEYLMGRTIKYGYYKRSNTDQEICKLINEKATIADYEVVFCTNYLSVGVDIKDKFEFASIYLGKFSGYEIEQFNARIRKKGIYSIYCITIDENENDLLKEPDLSIQITDDDKLRFIDDKEIANAKNTFVTEYDPVLGNVSTPGFTLFNGKIQFNPEEYELINFEDKYLEAMQHPTKIARVLYKYGYEIKISTEFEGLSQKEQDELKKIGLDSAKAEKIRKHNLIIYTFIDLINKNKYVNEYGLEFNNIIDWISKNLSDTELIVEDRTITDYVQISFDTFATPKLCIVQSRIALEKMIRFAKFLVKKYSPDRCIQLIMQYVNEDGILQQKKFSRAIQLIKLIESSENAQLSEPIIKIVEDIYVFLDQFELDKNKRIPYDTYKSTIEKWTYDYIESIGVKINTKYAFDKIKDSIIDLLSNIAEKSTSKNGISFNYILLPEQNNQELINKQTIDVMITNMFNVTQKLHTTRGISKYKHTKKLKDQEF